jgi:hypothetical protein
VKHYDCNTVDHGNQYDMVKVHERAALMAETDTENLYVKDNKLAYPDGVVFSHNNIMIISPTPATAVERGEGTLATRSCQLYPTNPPLLAVL